jgi:intein-encoded DNA endonuclease-like protein
MGVLREYRHRTLEERLKLYSSVRELHGKGVLADEIGQALSMSREDVSYWLRVDRPSRNIYDPDLTPRPELVYLVGAYLGDGRTAGPQDKKVRFKVADIEFAKLLNTLTARILCAKEKPVTLERGFHCVDYDSAVLYDFLQQPLENLIPTIESNPNMFLRGFFDAEGYVTQTVNDSLQTLTAIRVGAANCVRDYLEIVGRFLSALGITWRIRVTNKAGQAMVIRGRTFYRKRDVYHVEITSSDCVKAFQAHVDFSIPEKKRKLADLISLISISDPIDRYQAFTMDYRRIGRKWFRRDRTEPSRM